MPSVGSRNIAPGAGVAGPIMAKPARISASPASAGSARGRGMTGSSAQTAPSANSHIRAGSGQKAPSGQCIVSHSASAKLATPSTPTTGSAAPGRQRRQVISTSGKTR